MCIAHLVHKCRALRRARRCRRVGLASKVRVLVHLHKQDPRTSGPQFISINWRCHHEENDSVKVRGRSTWWIAPDHAKCLL